MDKSQYLNQKSTILYNISKFNDRVYLLRACSIKLALQNENLVFARKNALDDLRIVDYLDAATIRKRFGKEVYWKFFFSKYEHDFYFIVIDMEGKKKNLFLSLEDGSYSFEKLSLKEKINSELQK